MFDFFNGRIMDDVLDSRDVVDEVDDIMQEWSMYMDRPLYTHDPLQAGDWAILNLDREGRTAFGDEAWGDGVTLIRDSYFVEYAQELAEDLGAVPTFFSWPASCIDWQAAAEALQQDYTMLCVDGVTWWGRA